MHPDELEYVARVFKSLADASRQRILELLRETGEMSVNDIAGHFSFAQPTVSQHLRVLKDVGAVKSRKAGQQVFYRICNERMYDAMAEFIGTYQTEVRRADDV